VAAWIGKTGIARLNPGTKSISVAFRELRPEKDFPIVNRLSVMMAPIRRPSEQQAGEGNADDQARCHCENRVIGESSAKPSFPISP
jgi:hypothetical protein